MIIYVGISSQDTAAYLKALVRGGKLKSVLVSYAKERTDWRWFEKGKLVK